MIKRADLGLVCKLANLCTLLKKLRIGVLRAKMTKHADLWLRTLFCTNRKELKSCARSAEMTVPAENAENAVLDKLKYFVKNH